MPTSLRPRTTNRYDPRKASRSAEVSIRDAIASAAYGVRGGSRADRGCSGTLAGITLSLLLLRRLPAFAIGYDSFLLNLVRDLPFPAGLGCNGRSGRGFRERPAVSHGHGRRFCRNLKSLCHMGR